MSTIRRGREGELVADCEADRQPVTEEVERDALGNSLVSEFMDEKMPYFKRVGML